MVRACRLLVLATVLALPTIAHALPAPGPLRFVAPTPGGATPVTSGTVNVRVDAACSFDTNTLAVSLNGTALPASAFRPFSACSGGRITSQTVAVAVNLQRWNSLDASGRPQPHPIDDALATLYRVAMYG